MKSKDKIECSTDKFFALEQTFYSSLKFCIGQKKSLPSRKLAAMNFDIHLSPHSIREMKDTSLKSWSGCTWKNITLMLLEVVEEWVLMTPP